MAETTGLPSLLLLPLLPPLTPATAAALSAAYGPALEAALAQTRDAGRPSTLVVAVVGRLLQGPPDPGRKQLAWKELQALLAGVYTVLAVVGETAGVATELDGGPGAVDARVVLVDDGGGDSGDGGGGHQPTTTATRELATPNCTAVVDLDTFAAAYHPWRRVFSVDGAAGQRVRDAYLGRVQQRAGAGAPVPAIADDQRTTVPAGTEPAPTTTGGVPPAPTPPPPPPPTQLSRCVCLGGTFDHLHVGHKLLLTAGALLLDLSGGGGGGSGPARYIIGITGDQMLRGKKYAAFVQPWDVRARGVLAFLATVLGLWADGGWGGDGRPRAAADERGDGKDRLECTFRAGAVVVECVRIEDGFGPTIERPGIEYLVVSEETRKGADDVNKHREGLDWQPLKIFAVDVLSADEAAAALGAAGGGGGGGGAGAGAGNWDAKISSTAIRKRRAEAAAAAAAAGN